jgi:hypothetical protein
MCACAYLWAYVRSVAPYPFLCSAGTSSGKYEASRAKKKIAIRIFARTHERTPPLLQAHMAFCRVLLGVGVWHGVAEKA